MAGDRFIDTGGGNYNEFIQGDSINVQGNYINISQDLARAAAQIQQLLIQLETQGETSESARQKVANQLANQAKNQPEMKHRLSQLGRYLGNAAAGGVISEAALTVLKMALGIAGIPF